MKTKVSECLDCGGGVYATRLKPTEPSVEITEYHSKECNKLNVYENDFGFFNRG